MYQARRVAHTIMRPTMRRESIQHSFMLMNDTSAFHVSAMFMIEFSHDNLNARSALSRDDGF
jgi:hypothetical protein